MAVLKNTVEKRRNELIRKLMAFNHYKKDEKHLFELSLSELEHEYFKIQTKGHPHTGNGSIRWKNF
ncbi:Fur-regulated basic protein FbpA [Bacillus sp. REN16]|uniref:Fur-regulated basic protein FbpA n=1 Tax=Bacillus sp. REN16 TaxID=2887296 RepID=UPI001E4BA513|nr:Fur-regulated basic protein FbpA [Bacillus sp. REN16]MCC3357126.1 Fur-regulated basic protein FbpA [Bacillus sp. REN16]